MSAHTDTKNNPQTVLIVDDEPDMLTMLQLVLKRQCDCQVVLAQSGKNALQKLKEYKPDVVITDIKMPDMDGLALLKRIRDIDDTISIIIMTGYGTVEMAVEALKEGAYDFLEKPFNKDHIVRTIHHCLERTKLLRNYQSLQAQLIDSNQLHGFIGNSPALKKALDLIALVADTDATILIRGNSGTGKEGAAKALHALSHRKQNRMITVNCPTLPEQILESELFGYSKGAFTGATSDKKGLFEEANHSTILLDEIADIPVSIQTKLLRVLQEKEIQPLGQNKSIKVDVRVVASTNQDLEAKIESGEFREDLYYRLNVINITMPSLSDMSEDIPLLSHHFLALFKKEYNRPDIQFAPDAIDYLYHRHWPGNVRELQNIIKRVVIVAREEVIDAAALKNAEQKHSGRLNCSEMQQAIFSLPYNDAKAEATKHFTVAYISNVLNQNNGNVTSAAQKSGMDRQALQRIMRRYNMKSADFRKKD
ncbi:MAG: sigma-54-dependent Fis family transcriptional regulator [Desulfobulbaceae bacterium]|uniref:Sigma-54-dependent Fis family transcriptional regulator n=1 Tax=Candidatus Desulfobia pelagia TaxID=2841692 RepID=A0A8J6NBI4_9BACT|nr:sigma-54-dependent Fis family transcriptional regulator [Candidatus Desulfobia pelagia]